MKNITLKQGLYFGTMIAVAVLWLIPAGNRTWWVFVLSSYVFGFLVLALRHCTIKDIWQSFFDKRVWLHSTMFNEALLALLVYVFVYYGLQFLPDPGSQDLPQFFAPFFKFLGLHATTERPPAAIIALYTLCTALMYDLGYYLAHVLLHRNRFLWEIHKVHHSAQVMTPFTAVRMHPIEVFLANIFRMSFVGITTAFFLYLYPTDLMMISVGGTNIVLFLFLFLGGALAHSNIWISFGPLEKIFISPAMHQVHHSTNPQHFNKNYAFIFSFWDRMFGTVHFTDKDEHVTFGLGEKENAKYLTFKDVTWTPILRGLKTLKRRKI